MDDSDVAQEQIQTSYLPLLVNNLQNLIISKSELGSTTAPILPVTRPPISSPPFPSFVGDSILLDDPNPPEFIEHAYSFLIANIHNPYPTREEKQAIVDKSNSTRASLISVSNWFINARRRCGWAEILKRRCGGNREEMISLAKQIFVEEDPERPVVDPQAVAEFMDMKRNLESMDEKEARTSAWIENLTRLVDSAPSNNCRESSVGDQRQERRGKNIRVQTFPTAEKVKRWSNQRDQNDMEHVVSSPGLFFLSPLDALDEDRTFASGSVSSKRKNFHDDRSSYGRRNISPALSSFSSPCDLLDGRAPSLSWSDDDERPHKRSRSNISTPITPSPRSRDLLLDGPFDLSPPPTLPYDFPVMPARGQKRSYFDFDAPLNAKRMRLDTIRGALGVTHLSDLLDITERVNANIDAATDTRRPPADFSQQFQSTSNDGMQIETDAYGLDVSSERDEIDSQPAFPLLVAPPQFVPEQSPPPAPLSEPSLPDLPIDLSSLELTSLWPQSHPQISLTEPSDLSGLMLGLSSTHISPPIPLTPAVQDSALCQKSFPTKATVEIECARYLEKERD